jgi:hypothetical protein
VRRQRLLLPQHALAPLQVLEQVVAVPVCLTLA